MSSVTQKIVQESEKVFPQEEASACITAREVSSTEREDPAIGNADVSAPLTAGVVGISMSGDVVSEFTEQSVPGDSGPKQAASDDKQHESAPPNRNSDSSYPQMEFLGGAVAVENTSPEEDKKDDSNALLHLGTPADIIGNGIISTKHDPDKYPIVKNLGRGAFGQVDLISNGKKSYALKQYHFEDLQNSKHRDLALEEGKILQRIVHPNIVRCFWVQVTNYTIYLLLQFIDGGDLSNYIARRREKKARIPEKRVATWFSQLLEALAHVHQLSILHRDIKPSNILVTGDYSRVYLADFGVCRMLKTKRGLATTNVGSPVYAAPEVWSGKSYSNKVDIFSLGCCMFEVCSFKPPFDGRNLVEICRQIYRGPPKVKGTFPALGVLISSMLSANPAHRPSARHLLEKVPEILRASGGGKRDSLITPRVNRGETPKNPLQRSQTDTSRQGIGTGVSGGYPVSCNIAPPSQNSTLTSQNRTPSRRRPVQRHRKLSATYRSIESESADNSLLIENSILGGESICDYSLLSDGTPNLPHRREGSLVPGSRSQSVRITLNAGTGIIGGPPSGLNSANQTTNGLSSANQTTNGLSSANQTTTGLSSANQTANGLTSSNQTANGLTSANQNMINPNQTFSSNNNSEHIGGRRSKRGRSSGNTSPFKGRHRGRRNRNSNNVNPTNVGSNNIVANEEEGAKQVIQPAPPLKDAPLNGSNGDRRRSSGRPRSLCPSGSARPSSNQASSNRELFENYENAAINLSANDEEVQHYSRMFAFIQQSEKENRNNRMANPVYIHFQGENDGTPSSSARRTRSLTPLNSVNSAGSGGKPNLVIDTSSLDTHYNPFGSRPNSQGENLLCDLSQENVYALPPGKMLRSKHLIGASNSYQALPYFKNTAFSVILEETSNAATTLAEILTPKTACDDDFLIQVPRSRIQTPLETAVSAIKGVRKTSSGAKSFCGTPCTSGSGGTHSNILASKSREKEKPPEGIQLPFFSPSPLHDVMAMARDSGVTVPEDFATTADESSKRSSVVTRSSVVLDTDQTRLSSEADNTTRANSTKAPAVGNTTQPPAVNNRDTPPIADKESARNSVVLHADITTPSSSPIDSVKESSKKDSSSSSTSVGQSASSSSSSPQDSLANDAVTNDDDPRDYAEPFPRKNVVLTGSSASSSSTARVSNLQPYAPYPSVMQPPNIPSSIQPAEGRVSQSIVNRASSILCANPVIPPILNRSIRSVLGTTGLHSNKTSRMCSPRESVDGLWQTHSQYTKTMGMTGQKISCNCPNSNYNGESINHTAQSTTTNTRKGLFDRRSSDPSSQSNLALFPMPDQHTEQVDEKPVTPLPQIASAQNHTGKSVLDELWHQHLDFDQKFDQKPQTPLADIHATSNNNTGYFYHNLTTKKSGLSNSGKHSGLNNSGKHSGLNNSGQNSGLNNSGKKPSLNHSGRTSDMTNSSMLVDHSGIPFSSGSTKNKIMPVTPADAMQRSSQMEFMSPTDLRSLGKQQRFSNCSPQFMTNEFSSNGFSLQNVRNSTPCEKSHPSGPLQQQQLQFASAEKCYIAGYPSQVASPLPYGSLLPQHPHHPPLRLPTGSAPSSMSIAVNLAAKMVSSTGSLESPTDDVRLLYGTVASSAGTHKDSVNRLSTHCDHLSSCEDLSASSHDDDDRGSMLSSAIDGVCAFPGPIVIDTSGQTCGGPICGGPSPGLMMGGPSPGLMMGSNKNTPLVPQPPLMSKMTPQTPITSQSPFMPQAPQIISQNPPISDGITSTNPHLLPRSALQIPHGLQGALNFPMKSNFAAASPCTSSAGTTPAFTSLSNPIFNQSDMPLTLADPMPKSGSGGQKERNSSSSSSATNANSSLSSIVPPSEIKTKSPNTKKRQPPSYPKDNVNGGNISSSRSTREPRRPTEEAPKKTFRRQLFRVKNKSAKTSSNNSSKNQGFTGKSK